MMSTGSHVKIGGNKTMEELKEKAFRIIDLNFKVLFALKSKNKQSAAQSLARQLYGQISMLHDLDLITFENWKFLYNAIDCVVTEL